MDPVQNQEEVSGIAALAQTQEGMAALVASNAFMEDLNSDITLTDEQYIIIDGEITMYFSENKSAEDVISTVREHLLFSLRPEIAERLVHRVDSFLQLHKHVLPETIETKNTAEPAILHQAEPASNLSSITSRLQQPSATIPSTRDYTLQKGIVPDNLPITEPATESADPTIKPLLIDPYHESIDNI